MGTLTIKEKPKDYDSDDVFVDGKFVGYKGRKSGRLGLIRCPACDRENWAMAVSGGICAWCGYNLNDEGRMKKDKDVPIEGRLMCTSECPEGVVYFIDDDTTFTIDDSDSNDAYERMGEKF